MSEPALQVRGLHSRLGDLHILRGVDLEVPFGEVHALMGPNGSGKSTLCHTLMGKAEYTASGSALVGGTEVLGLSVDERARAGLFEGFQYPVEVPGVTLRELMAEIALVGGPEIVERAAVTAETLGMERFLDRSVNAGLSGGEKKRSEMFQLGSLAPKVAILDEIDSGLDIDAVREVAAAVEAMRGPDLGVLVITHYSRILRYLTVDRIHVMVAGRIVDSGGSELAEQLESTGYDALNAAHGEAAEQSVSESFLDGL
jgi:Fe-S cluster assembly ATP-binding protein